MNKHQMMFTPRMGHSIELVGGAPPDSKEPFWKSPFIHKLLDNLLPIDLCRRLSLGQPASLETAPMVQEA
jgi:hypothetical protein